MTGCCNIATGAAALLDNIQGSFNIAIGRSALRHTIGSNNIGIGEEAGVNATTGDDNIYIGNQGGAGQSGAIRIGTAGRQTSTFIAGISGVNVGAGAAPVFMNTLSGQLGTIASTKRVKEAIEDMGEASRGLRRLRPVTFRYRQPAEDGSQPRQYGLIAEEVAAVYPELVAYGADGEPSTVAYHLLPAMLLNELQRQAAELAGQQAQITAQAAQLATQEARLREQGQEMAALRALVEELRARSETSPVTAAR
jgi:hypothetical protein